MGAVARLIMVLTRPRAPFSEHARRRSGQGHRYAPFLLVRTARFWYRAPP